MLDLFLATSIGLSLVVLLTALQTQDALEFSSFPALLLLLTLFRLALNVASTRLILGQGHAGEVIQAFGKFVIGGNYAVGLVLFLILIGEHARWTGSPRLLDELRPAVDAALAWMDTDGDSDGDGYLDYVGKNAQGLINQGWKDSALGVPRKDGGAPVGPIALCEVQGYAYLARTRTAEALRAAGDVEGLAVTDLAEPSHGDDAAPDGCHGR